MELTGYFDYEAYGRLNMKASERLTDEGLVTRINAPKPAVGKKQNPEVVQPGSVVFRVYLAFDKKYPEKICFISRWQKNSWRLLRRSAEHMTLMRWQAISAISGSWSSSYLQGSHLGELNQIAMEIQNLADKTTVLRKKLLASLWSRRFPGMQMRVPDYSKL